MNSGVVTLLSSDAGARSRQRAIAEFLPVRLFRRFIDLLMPLSMILVACLTLASLREVVGRYVFNNPSSWTSEYSQYGVAALIFFGCSYAARHDAMIRVEVVSERLAPRVRHVLSIVTRIIGILGLAFVTWMVLDYVWSQYEGGVRSASQLRVPLAVPKVAMALGMVLWLVEEVVSLVEVVAMGPSGLTAAGEDLETEHGTTAVVDGSV